MLIALLLESNTIFEPFAKVVVLIVHPAINACVSLTSKSVLPEAL